MSTSAKLEVEQVIMETEHVRICSTCKLDKPISYFSLKGVDKLASQCKDCIQARARVRNANRVVAMTGTKVCRDCKVDKDVSEYSVNKATKDGRRGDCKACHAAWHRAFYAQNKTRPSWIEERRACKKRSEERLATKIKK